MCECIQDSQAGILHKLTKLLEPEQRARQTMKRQKAHKVKVFSCAYQRDLVKLHQLIDVRCVSRAAFALPRTHGRQTLFFARVKLPLTPRPSIHAVQ